MMKHEPANENVLLFRRKESVQPATDHSNIDDVLVVAEWAIRGTAEKLRELSPQELEILWQNVSRTFNQAPEFDAVSDAFMSLIEYEMDCRNDGGSIA